MEILSFIIAKLSFIWEIGLPFLVALTILVFVHELGHYSVAKWCNVKVEVFSIGFGPELFGWNDGDGTRWKISVIPLGGYVKMLESRESEETLDEQSLNQCFDKQSVYKKFLIVAAGPAFNLILAVIFFIFVHFSGITGMKPYITSIDNHLPQTSDLMHKYEIIKVNGINTKRWQDVRIEILNSVVNSKNLNIHIKSDSNNIQVVPIKYDKDILKLDGDIITNIGLKVKTPEFPAIIGFIEDNSPAFGIK